MMETKAIFTAVIISSFYLLPFLLKATSEVSQLRKRRRNGQFKRKVAVKKYGKTVSCFYF